MVKATKLALSRLFFAIEEEVPGISVPTVRAKLVMVIGCASWSGSWLVSQHNCHGGNLHGNPGKLTSSFVPAKDVSRRLAE